MNPLEKLKADGRWDSMDYGQKQEEVRSQAARDLRADKMHTTKGLCATCRATFGTTPTVEQLAVSVWALAEKMPRETMMALVVELLSAYLRREGGGKAGNGG